MAQVIKDVVTWLKQWFYTEDEVDTITGGLQTQINNKADSSTVSNLSTTVSGKANASHTHGNLKSDGSVGTSGNISKNVVTDGSGKITTEDKYSHPSSHASSMIVESSALSNIGTSANATQQDINSAIDSVLANFSSIDVINVVSNKGSASASTMNKLYIEVGTDSTDVYYTTRSGTSPNYTYSWEKLDSAILEDVSLEWSNIQNKPSTFTPSSHSHTEYADKTATVGTTITLVDKGQTNEGCIIFNTIS